MIARVTSLVLLTALVACKPSTATANSAEAQQRGDPTMKVEADDPAMEAAKRQGRATLPDFFRRYAAPAAGERMFSIKYDLLPGPDVEYIWASVERHEAGKTVAKLGNAPEAPGYELGQEVTVRDADVIDWQIFKNGRAEGHFTTKVLLDKMPADEAAQYRAALGW